jgi:hypothetical protein
MNPMRFLIKYYDVTQNRANFSEQISLDIFFHLCYR